MSDAQPPEQSQALAQARAKQQRLANAFMEVFGSPNKRTPSQKLVLDHLGVCAGDEQNSYRFNEAKDGLALVAAGIHRDGARSLLRVIDRQVKIASNISPPAKAKPKTTR